MRQGRTRSGAPGPRAGTGIGAAEAQGGRFGAIDRRVPSRNEGRGRRTVVLEGRVPPGYHRIHEGRSGLQGFAAGWQRGRGVRRLPKNNRGNVPSFRWQRWRGSRYHHRYLTGLRTCLNGRGMFGRRILLRRASTGMGCPQIVSLVRLDPET